MKCRAREHDHSGEVVEIAKTEGGTDDEFDFVVGGLGASTGEPELGGSNDGSEVALNLLAQIPEHGDPAPLGPGHPLGEGIGDLVRASLESQTQIFLEQVGTVELWIGLGEEL